MMDIERRMRMMNVLSLKSIVYHCRAAQPGTSALHARLPFLISHIKLFSGAMKKVAKGKTENDSDTP